MTSEKGINLFQYSIFLIHAKIGVGMITLASDVHATAEYDGWISTLIAGLFIQIIILLYGLLIRRYPNKTLFEIIEIILGKVLGKMMMLLYLAYLLIVGGILLAKYTVILKTWMMPLTPGWVLVSFICLIGVYVAKENLHVITRFFVLNMIVIAVFLGFIIYALKDVNYTYILPIGNSGLKAITKGAITTISSYQGFEYILVLSPLALATPKQIVKTATITNVSVTTFYTFITITVQMFFSSEELGLITEPIFYIVKSFAFTIIERPDLLFTSMWIVLVVTSIITLFYIASLGLQIIFGQTNRTSFTYIVAIVCFILSMFLYGEYRINRAMELFYPIVILFSTGLPILLLILSLIFRKKEDHNED